MRSFREDLIGPASDCKLLGVNSTWGSELYSFHLPGKLLYIELRRGEGFLRVDAGKLIIVRQ